MGNVWVNGVLQVPPGTARLGSFIPEDLIAAVQPRGDVVLVEQHDPELSPTPRARSIAYDGLTAVVERGGRVLALMTAAQWARRDAGCRWRRVPPPGANLMPDREPAPALPAYTVRRPQRAE